MKDENAGFNWFLGIAVVVILLLVAWGTFSNDNTSSLDVEEFASAVGLSVGNAVEEKLANYFLATNTGEDVSDSGVNDTATTTLDSGSDYDLEEIAWNEVVDEFEDDDAFLTCNGHEYDDDEYEYDIEFFDIDYERAHQNGDVTVTLDVEFDFEDNSDERDCKVDRTFEIFWEDNDFEDEDWDEAEVTWVRDKVPTTA